MQHQFRWDSETASDNVFACQKCSYTIGFNKPGIGEPAADQRGPLVGTFEDYLPGEALECAGPAQIDELTALTKAVLAMRPAATLVSDGTLSQAEADKLSALTATKASATIAKK